MNKYLEKIAGMPRFLGRAMKQGLSETMKEAKGVGARAAKAERSEKIYSSVRQKFYKADRTAQADGLILGTIKGTNQRSNKLYDRSEKAFTRMDRRHQAARLAQQSSKKALEVGKKVALGAAGTAAVGTAATVAATKKD